MNHATPTTGDHDPAPPRHGRLRAVAGFVLGVMLFAAAVWAIVTGGADLQSSVDAARRAPWWLVAAVVGLPIVNWLSVSASFHVLHNHYGRVGRVEMAALIASAWLLNYLPFKPGMFGRLAYHKKINGTRYADSARILGLSVGLSAAAFALLILIALLVRVTPDDLAWAWCLPAPIALAAATLALRPRGGWAWRLTLAGLLRYVDMMTWIGRYAASFALVGAPLSFESALVVSAVSQAALLIPIAGNGLGVREWGVRAVTEPAGLLADVVNRAAELCVSLPVGLAGSAFAARRLARAGDHPPPPGPIAA